MVKIKDACTGRFLSGDKTIKNCLKCNKEFSVVPSSLIKRKYCSKECWKKRSPKELFKKIMCHEEVENRLRPRNGGI